MFAQHEHVPQQYSLVRSPDSPKEEEALSIVLESASTEDNSTRSPRWSLEAIRPGVFRTTFTTADHPLPPFPSATCPHVDLADTSLNVTHGQDGSTGVIRSGKAKAVVDWTGAPVVSISLDGMDSPIHEDLAFRSYAIDGSGIAHYTKWKKDTLHVGLGEKAAPMDLSGRGFLITASDTFGYDSYKTDPLYKHIPWLMNVTPEGCIGIFSTSHSRGSWSIGSEIDGLWGHYKVYRQAHGGLEEYVIVGETVAEVVRSYAELVGFPLLVPRYMMGYIGGGMKYSMEDSPRAHDSILNFILNCEKNGMPCSAFQMSSGYTVAESEPKTRNVMTWNRHRFPDPRAFTRESHKHGVRLLANVKPYILANHPAYPELADAGAFFTDPMTKKSGVARLWSAGGGESGEGSHIDFTSKAGYDWWYNGVVDLKRVGIDAMWNDNNEYNIVRDDWECALETVGIPSTETRKDIGLWGRAVSTELMGKSSHDATLEAEPNERPLVLTRSATAGTMRYCASSWSGDNVTSWQGMKGANALALNAGFSLLQCYGHDIGGFEGPQPTPEHLVRWIQLGIHSPRFAINCYKTNPDDNLVGEVIEPWQYPSVSPIIRTAIKRRYELVPYTYSLMLKSHRDALPPQRWTGWGYESDPTVWSKEITQSDTQYWFGDALMVAGVYEPGVSSARVYLPGHETDPGFLNTSAPYEYLAAGRWHNISATWHTSIPVIARIGSAIPIGKPAPTTCVAEDDVEFPNIAKDNWRGVEIFPPPTNRHPESGESSVKEEASSRGIKWFTNEWLEDDGISPEGKADLFSVNISYGVHADQVQVSVTYDRPGRFEPLWLKAGLNIALPIGDERALKLSGNAQGQLHNEGRDEKGRYIWRYTVIDCV
ncbi:family 31 glycosyl hydrolase [Truncatella angustata]|uniref:alpha-glucosidase n=1 Tax=Truncatella angustata TaxID=152316 RepID=A0A9P8ZYL6_9PEZI|nr:family 31 glycosyl hydrolase [Truncatella angustata]KAH6654155.1 family 31 glycosyl hydrolase [Truncatella angustata]